MKKIIFLFLVSFLIGCGINDTSPFEEGKYSGTFEIVEADGQSSTGTVDFTFGNNKYSNISSDMFSLPSGSGEYSVRQNIIRITDIATHVGIIDLTKLLNGNFEISYYGKVLILKQNDTEYNRKRTITLIKQD